ncbi:unnamed protein product, partial [Ectocarpus sp. 12 AP-2014]
MVLEPMWVHTATYYSVRPLRTGVLILQRTFFFTLYLQYNKSYSAEKNSENISESAICVMLTLARAAGVVRKITPDTTGAHNW